MVISAIVDSLLEECSATGINYS